MKKIVYGICGIGNGHLYRQLPIIEYLLSQRNMVFIFTYGTAYDFFNQKYLPSLSKEQQSLLKIALVDVPYYIGNRDGLNFDKAAEINSTMSMKNNLQAFAQAQYWIGKPDLVITDYEPYSAQYGYAYQSRVVTIDQQSKYLLNTLPHELKEFTYMDEIMRLKMFFPIAHKRIACSFFRVPDSEQEKVEVIPTNIRPKIINIKNNPIDNPHYIVYLTSQPGFEQTLDEIIFALAARRQERFVIFLDKDTYLRAKRTIDLCKTIHKHIYFVPHGEPLFEKLLCHCHGIISTAGHTLLSEAMYLGIPVYAMPLPLYEQQLNAEVIGANQFGINAPSLTQEGLQDFILNNKLYRNNILNDTKVLLRKDGLNIMINLVKSML
jgi:uncharacterized protein (TIGR00661 family)